MDEFVAYIVKNLVDEPDNVQVSCREENGSFFVSIRVANGDIGKVVGKKGNTINALRTIVMTVATRLGRRVRVELLDE